MAGEGGASPEGAELAQLKVPGSPAGAIIGGDIPPGIPPGIVEITPSSQQGAGPAAGPQGSQTGPQGAAIGATAGGLTQGMRGRQARKTIDSGMEATVASYHQKLTVWDKHFMAAMEGKGYTVK